MFNARIKNQQSCQEEPLKESLLQKNMCGFQLKRVYMVYEKEEDKWTTWWGTIINPVTWMMAFDF